MKKRQIFSIEDKTYKTYPLFIVGGTFEEAKTYLLKKHYRETEQPSGGVGTVMTFDTNSYPSRVVWLKSFKKNSNKDMAVLTHELLHLIVRIAEDKGIHFVSTYENGDIGDEAVCYLMEFYIEEFLNKIKYK